MPESFKGDSFPDDRQYNLWLLLSQTRSAIFRSRQKRMGSYLHPNQALALCTIWIYKGQATPAILARILFLERHSVSELISRMVEKGLVTKTRDEKKKNIVRVDITEKGRKVGRQVIQLDFIKSIFSMLTDEQQEQLQTSLQILLTAAQKEMGSGFTESIQGLKPDNNSKPA
ncbi:MAG TPA: MarR family winged helix-turn-helix transcriptional regulator [Dehalococcoidales bacterium]|nr:MarR family winged helix-turn-helix transcriptional regulator [Dehalococcoidales bacterium]